MISRILSSSLANSPKSVLLLGPRQVGKSTLMRALAPDLEINLADHATFLEFVSNPQELKQRLAATNARRIFIDEVQKIPTLLDTMQALLDSPAHRDKLKFFLTGSSARKLRRGNANLLPGRILVYHLGPLASCELNYNMDARRGLEVGFLPEVLLADRSPYQNKLLSSYASTYVTEEIQAEALTRNLEGFARFLQIASAVAGQSLDFSKMAKQAKISRASCNRFVEILEDTLIGRRVLPCPFIDAELVKHPKLYFFDVGVLNGLLGNFVASPDRLGLLTEHLIFNQLVQSAQAHDKTIDIYSFRTRGGLEVDFIVKLDGEIWALEVKSGNVGGADMHGLHQLAAYMPSAYQSMVLTLDGAERKIGKTWILPWQRALQVMGL